MMYAVRNWQKFQHYKDRNPPWIKLHFELLSSEDWVMLDDASRLLAVVCMLIASRNEGCIDTTDKGLAYLRRVAYLNKKPNINPLIECGFLIPDSKCKQMLADARPETETETEKNPPPPRKRGTLSAEQEKLFDLFWQSYPRKVARGAAEKRWAAIKPDGEMVSKMISAIASQKKSTPWQDQGGKFIPYPATWLHGKRWDDVIQPTATQPDPPKFQRRKCTDCKLFPLAECPEETRKRNRGCPAHETA